MGRFADLSALYWSTLLEDVLPFWEKHSLDTECGGYLTCLDRAGNVYDTDKFVWFQARQVWMFSMLYNRLEKRQSWLDIARHGASFLRRHGRDAEGNWYFVLDRQGRPLVQPYNIFSEYFAGIAFSQYALATGDDDARQVALQAFHNYVQRRENPKGKWTKAVPGTRPLKMLGVSMMLSNLALELEWLLPGDTCRKMVDESVSEVLDLFLDRRRLLVHEYALPDGSHLDCFDGRTINPGHGIEEMWFLMDIGRRRGDRSLIEKAVDIMLSTIDFGWDGLYGGIYHFRDALGKPPLQLEWDQKLWWVHAETLVALVMGYALTGRSECWEWYERVHEYTWAHFPDPDYGEWFGYLNRRGEPLLELKGGKWKGCFHVPRALYLCAMEFDGLAAAGKVPPVA